MTRDGPVTTQEETTQHVCQVTPTPAAPVGCAIPPPTTHPGSIVQPRERLSPAGDAELFAVLGVVSEWARTPEAVKPSETSCGYLVCMRASGVGWLIQATLGNFGGVGGRANRAGWAT
jgi:hypothetical protein